MRKIWLRKDREKRKSLSGGSALLYSNNPDSIPDPIFEDDLQSVSESDDANSTLANQSFQDSSSIHPSINTVNGKYSSKTSHSYSASTSSSITVTKAKSSSQLSPEGLKSVASLARSDYDIKTEKQGWLNVIVNSQTANEISEQTMRLFRAELKGSHLYLYKPNPTLNIRSFKLDEPGEIPGVSSNYLASNNSNQTSNNLTGNNELFIQSSSNSLAGNPTPSAPSTPTTDIFKHANSSSVTIHDIGAPVPTTTSTSTAAYTTANATPPSTNAIMTSSSSDSNVNTPEVPSTNVENTSTIPSTEYTISYFDTKVPHPDLLFNFESHQLTLASATVQLAYTPSHTSNGNSMESLVHFVLFNIDSANEEAITTIIAVWPILSTFGKILKLIGSFLTDLFSKKFKGSYDLKIIINRILTLLHNVEDNFNGFLLKSDIAPYILKILETLKEYLEHNRERNHAIHKLKELELRRSPTLTQESMNGTNHDIDSELDDESYLEELQLIQQFKNRMLVIQQTLIDLVSNNGIKDVPEMNPFRELNSVVFMNDINLIELALTISAIDLRFFSTWNSNVDKSLLLYSSINSHLDDSSTFHTSSADFFYKKNPLIFNNDHHIHYLSRLLINHLFVENSSSKQNTSAVSFSSNSVLSSSILERKARLLEKWIDLGCLLDKSGNMTSWLGISSIILSQPVLRLTKIWSLVSPEYIKLLKNDWSPVLFELDRRYLANGSLNADTNTAPSSPTTASHNEKSIGSSAVPNGKQSDISLGVKDSYHIMAPRGLGKIYPKEKVIPYFGDLIINNVHTSSANLLELESIWKKINYSFNRWNEYLSNLANYNDIIKYNDDVLRRYDSMGFIFSNESLNQVLYLGVNNDDSKPLPSTCEEVPKPLHSSTKDKFSLQSKLLRLVEVNCDSVNLEKIMRLSLMLEPELPEAYLRSPSVSSLEGQALPNPDLSHLKHGNSSSSNFSINSSDSSTLKGASHTYPENNASAFNEYSPSSKIPSFNNNFFKINLSKYDDLTNSLSSLSDTKLHLQQILDPQVNKHNFIVDEDLTFRLDDFIDMDLANSTTLNTLDDVDNVDDEEDAPGLGIDVDDILNSEKFNNFTMSPKPNLSDEAEIFNSATQSHSTNNKNPNNYSVISTESSSGISNQTYKYIPKYASIDKLVDLLLIDSKYFDETISVDLTEYRFVFLLNYNSFITTKDLLDKLAHRFINSGNAVISVMKKQYLQQTHEHGNENPNSFSPQNLQMEFPNWNLDTDIDLNQLGDVDYELLLKIQINILKVLIVLLNNFYSNFSLDLTNKTILIKLLKLFSNEILQWYNSNKIDTSLEKSFESLVNYYKKLKKLFVKKTYRPIEILKFEEYLITEFKFSNSLHEVPMNRNLPGHKNVTKIEKFLHKFNKLLAVFYKGIKIEDWIKVFKILENAFENNSLFEFNLQRNTTSDENLIISNIFNFFESLIDPEDKQLLLKKFPLVFRKLFKLYFKFRSYLLVQLTDLNITLDERLDRMKTLLLMVQISKLKMSDNQFVFEGGKESIPSCIETAITNVVYSPESRLFTNMWIKASNSLNSEDRSTENSFDDLNLLLPSDLKLSDLQNTEPLLPCFCWIIENLLETNKCPSFYKQHLNFNKRYLIFKLIKELGVEEVEGSSEGDINYHETREFDFLLKLDESLVNNQSLRDFTFLEKDKVKLFKGALRDQHKLLLLDNKKKAHKEKDPNYRNNQNSSNGNQSNTSQSTVNSINSNNSSNLNPQLNKKNSNSSLRRQSLSYKSNSTSRFKISGLFTKSRPFSLNVSGLSNSSGERIIRPRDLPAPENLEAKQKPFLIISMKSKKIFPVYLMPLCFKIDSETSNDDFFFQAPNETDLNEWLIKLGYANRHWFYSKTLNLKNNHSFTTFGIPISVICNREQTLVPKILTLLFYEIENEGLKDVGIYRISTSISELNAAKSMIDKTGTLNFQEKVYDVHTLTSIVKSYFRELPDALLTDKVIDTFFSLRQKFQDEEIVEGELISKYKETLGMLPLVNFHTLKLLLHHLQKISQLSEKNRMTASNIATVIGPALTEASSLDSLINNFGFMNSILEKMITNFDYVFDYDSSTTNESSSPVYDTATDEAENIT